MVKRFRNKLPRDAEVPKGCGYSRMAPDDQDSAAKY